MDCITMTIGVLLKRAAEATRVHLHIWPPSTTSYYYLAACKSQIPVNSNADR